jgi:hypothetical protein
MHECWALHEAGAGWSVQLQVALHALRYQLVIPARPMACSKLHVYRESSSSQCMFVGIERSAS